MMPANDDLLGRLIRGDERAFDEIFRTSYAPLVRAAESLLRDRAVAEEMVQEVMLELWRRRERLDPAGSIQAYLFQSTRNRALNHLRHLRVQQRSVPYLTVPEAREATAPSQAVAREIGIALAEALNELKIGRAHV